jgi:hypothetical protein
VTGLFALPVRRVTSASAKLIVYLLWTIGAAIVLGGMGGTRRIAGTAVVGA